MNKKKILLLSFFLVVLVQLYVPSKMIWDKEEVLRTGTEYKFRTAPIDPNDPFRGKYITLRFDNNIVNTPSEQDWKVGESIYVSMTTDDKGFAKIESVSKERPKEKHEFIKATVRSVLETNPRRLTIDYPFDRYYMEESKAYEAEQVYRESNRDTLEVTYALVSIKNGNAVLKDVLIDETSIKEIVKARQQGNK